MVLQAIRYDAATRSLEILNQLLLPHEQTYDAIANTHDAWDAIKTMRVRGAPAIAIVAALSLIVELSQSQANGTSHDFTSASEVKTYIHQRLDYLITSRPTAVNLADAGRKLKAVADSVASEEAQAVKEAYVKAAEQMLVDDVSDNEAIGRHGAEWIVSKSTQDVRNGELGKGSGVSVVTHCNTGSLATAGYGTALGVIRSLHSAGALKHAFCTETRPYNQGSRLTAFELVHDGIPATLVTDSMAAALLRLKGQSERIAAIVVGADRVAANGDTANKIGTYSLAILARFHGVKFLVAAPRTTIDMATASGAHIVIEERLGSEVTSIKGPRCDAKSGEVQLGSAEVISIAARGIGVWNPAFDVTPAELIDGIVTEVGVFEKDDAGKFDLGKAFK